MPWLISAIIALIAGYLIGHVQFAVIISKLKYKDDVRTHGSGNAGSTNMLRTFGLSAGIMTFVGDLIKGVAAALLGRLIGGEICSYLCGLGAVLGHNFPALLHFKGGKGAASTLGIALVVSPLSALITIAAAICIFLLTRIVSLVSLIGMTVFLGCVIGFEWANWPLIIFAVILWILIIVQHRENIRRLFLGQESSLTVESSKKPDNNEQQRQ